MPDADETAPDTEATDGSDETAEGDSFPRKVVEDLRRESAGYRERAKVAEQRLDELSRVLFNARVSATGKLADAADLEYSADLLDDADALNAAIDVLLTERPHYATRKRATGDVGQGERGDTVHSPTFAAMLQSHT